MSQGYCRSIQRLLEIIMVLVVVAACTPSVQPAPVVAPSTSTPAAPRSTLPPETTSQVPAGQSNRFEDVPDFQLVVYQGEDVLGGQKVQFSQILGQGKPVVLNFWAGLCPPCRLEMPDFQEVHTEYQDKIVLVGLDIGTFTGLGSEEDGRALLQELKITYPAGTTSEAKILQAYQVIGMPTTYFITPDGQIVQKWTGFLNKEKLSELIEELLEVSRQS